MAQQRLTARLRDGMGRALCRSRVANGIEGLMAKPELGTKRVCVACATRFYDLTRTPAVCPKCGTEQPTEQPRARRTGGNVADEKRLKKVPAPGLEDSDVEIETVEEEAEEDVLEDASDLEDDADAISGDIEVEPETDEKEI